jgi:hypothetical protein
MYVILESHSSKKMPRPLKNKSSCPLKHIIALDGQGHCDLPLFRSEGISSVRMMAWNTWKRAQFWILKPSSSLGCSHSQKQQMNILTSMLTFALHYSTDILINSHLFLLGQYNLLQSQVCGIELVMTKDQIKVELDRDCNMISADLVSRIICCYPSWGVTEVDNLK